MCLDPKSGGERNGKAKKDERSLAKSIRLISIFGPSPPLVPLQRGEAEGDK